MNLNKPAFQSHICRSFPGSGFCSSLWCSKSLIHSSISHPLLHHSSNYSSTHPLLNHSSTLQSLIIFLTFSTWEHLLANIFKGGGARSCIGASVVWCGVVWCGVVWRGVVWCGVVWCGVVWCGVVWCGVVWCVVVWCGVVCCGVVWCGDNNNNNHFLVKWSVTSTKQLFPSTLSPSSTLSCLPQKPPFFQP